MTNAQITAILTTVAILVLPASNLSANPAQAHDSYININSLSPWLFSEKFDVFTDKNISSLVLFRSVPNNSYNKEPQAAVIRCNGKGGFEIFIKFSNMISTFFDDGIHVTYRFGTDVPITEVWESSTSQDAAFMPGGYKHFVEGIKGGKNFVFQAEDFTGSLVRAEFQNSIDPNFDFVFGGCIN